MKVKEYDRQKVVEYAGKWAYSRNPQYYNFDLLGGDCTNFVSQCIYAGSEVMNYSKNNGWYYINGNDKSPSWTGVPFLGNFLVRNQSVGPFGRLSNIDEMELGDIVQLSFDGLKFSHSLVIVDIVAKNSIENILIAAHTDDCFNRRLDSYAFKNIRFIKIDGVNIW